MNITLPMAKSYEVDVFRNELCDQCGSFDLEPINTNSLQGCLSLLDCQALDVSLIGMSAKWVTRGKKNISADHEDHYFIILQHQGSALMCQNDRQVQVEAGDMFLVDSTLPSRFVYTSGYSTQISMHLPREEMKHRYGNSVYGGLSISKNDPMGQAMRSILFKMLNQAGGPKHHISDAFHSVFGALLIERKLGSGPRLSSNELIASRAVGLMSDHFRDSNFTAASVAQLMGISLRQLQRAFKAFGETPHSRLQQIRLEAAHQFIQREQRVANGVNVSFVAYENGFSELSTFYRMYKRRYGSAPKAAKSTD